MFSCIFGTFNLLLCAPHFKFIVEGRIAGKIAYDTINFKPEVDINPNGIKIEKEEMKGEIVFENVNFRYPSR